MLRPVTSPTRLERERNAVTVQVIYPDLEATILYYTISRSPRDNSKCSKTESNVEELNEAFFRFLI